MGSTYSSRQVIKFLEADGWYCVAIEEESHCSAPEKRTEEIRNIKYPKTVRAELLSKPGLTRIHKKERLGP